MGLLTEGTPLSWDETKKVAEKIKKHGILQFINLYNKLKDRSKDCLLWGDEVEYMLVKLDKVSKKPMLLLKADSLLEKLRETENSTNQKDLKTVWRPEYGAYMVEGTPGNPYGPRMIHFNTVEANMKRRRNEVMGLLEDDGQEFAMTLSAFPRVGCKDFTIPSYQPDPVNGASRSIFFPDEVIFPAHPRYKTLSRNVRERRGSKPAINIPIFRDTNTPRPFIEDFSAHLGPFINKVHDNSQGARDAVADAKEDHVYMDCMGFGMGCCCLQVTFQACNICEARVLYDQLTSLCPIMLALSASSPIHRGYLTDVDCRWNIISGSVDDRTKEERGLEPLNKNKFCIPKSRYAPISYYLSPCSQDYNDLDAPYDPHIYQQLIDNGIDKLLAKHMAHLFIRDPLSVFSEKLLLDDSEDTDHFENIQSTNWQTMRFKPPPPNSDIGWRVEFRPMEVQLTDFENAAYVVFVVLLTRVILTYKLNFVIPISKVDENMETAQKNDACRQAKFWFRKDISTCNTPKDAESFCCGVKKPPAQNGADYVSSTDDCQLLSIQEIISGKPGAFPGLKPLIERYINSMEDCDVDTCCTITQYLKLIEKRASGELMTTAQWTRDYVTKHPDYKQDSIIGETLAYDLLKECQEITFKNKEVPGFINKHITRTNDEVPTLSQKMETLHRNMATKQSIFSAMGDGP